MLTPESLFWIALLFFLHPYSTYPLSPVCLKYFTRGKSRFRAEHLASWDSMPSVSVLVVAHNEQNAIRARLENLLAMDYPADRMSIFVVSDASTDRTDGIVESYRSTVKFVRSLERIGKAACTNLGLREIRDEYVVFTDANTEFDTDAISKLIGPFQDPSIGYVVRSWRSVDRGSDFWRVTMSAICVCLLSVSHRGIEAFFSRRQKAGKLRLICFPTSWSGKLESSIGVFVLRSEHGAF